VVLALPPLQQDNQDADVALLKYRIAAAVLPASPLLWNNVGMCFFAKQVCNMERIAAPFCPVLCPVPVPFCPTLRSLLPRLQNAPWAAAAASCGVHLQGGFDLIALLGLRHTPPALFLQRYIAAISCLRRAQYLGPFEWLVAHNLGLVYLACGQPASAFQHLSTAVNLNPVCAHR
jgi:tetratricopeptide (TPR) repeat protein